MLRLKKWEYWISLSSKNDFKTECTLDGGRLWTLWCCSLLIDDADKHLPIALAEAMDLAIENLNEGWDSWWLGVTGSLGDKGKDKGNIELEEFLYCEYLLSTFAGAVVLDWSATLKALKSSLI